MKAAHGTVFKYGDNVDTDVIIPARYLNSSDPKELAQHCMEDIDKEFVANVAKGDISGREKLWMRLVKGTCANRNQSRRHKLCDRRDFCADFLPQRN